jgi:hypothetical protein
MVPRWITKERFFPQFFYTGSGKNLIILVLCKRIFYKTCKTKKNCRRRPRILSYLRPWCTLHCPEPERPCPLIFKQWNFPPIFPNFLLFSAEIFRLPNINSPNYFRRLKGGGFTNGTVSRDRQ